MSQEDEVLPLTEQELANLAIKVRDTLINKFGRDRVIRFMTNDPQIFAEFATQTFYTLRVKLHQKYHT
jgi:hypothetical protein